MEKLPFVEHNVSGAHNLVGKRIPDTVDVGGLVANEVTYPCSWSELVVSVPFEFGVICESVCLALVSAQVSNVRLLVSS